MEFLKQENILLVFEANTAVIFYNVIINLDLSNQEFGSRWMSIEKKSIWADHVIYECYAYCFFFSIR